MNILNLFKYYAPKYKGKDNLSFHTRGSIYFQKPSEFNDPWDCKLPEIICAYEVEKIKEICLKAGNKNSGKKLWGFVKSFHPARMRETVIDAIKTEYEMKRSEIGVFALSFIPDSELMWSHYTDSHSGYMLHFQVDKGLSGRFPVKYKKELKPWILEEYITDPKKYINELITFKIKVWKYECELRLFNPTKSGFIPIPKHWLTSIVIGIQTDDELRAKLKNIGKELAVPVYAAKINEKEYKVDIPGLGIDGKQGRDSYQKVIRSKRFLPSSTI